MFRIELEHITKGSIIDTPALESLELNLDRHDIYKGVFIMYSGDVTLKGALKDWVDDVFLTYGLDSTIDVTISESDVNQPYWKPKYTGVADGKIYEKKEYYSIISFVDSEFERDLISRDDLEVEYNFGESLDGTVLPGYSNYFQDVLFRGRAGGVDVEETGKAAFPFEVFEHIIARITNKTYRPFRSSVLGRATTEFFTEHGFTYAVDGDFAYLMLTNGAYISGFPANPATGHEEGKVSLYFKFKDLAKEFINAGNLGVGIGEDDDGNKIVELEPLKDFFIKQVLVEIDSCNNMKIDYDETYLIKGINPTFVKSDTDNDYGITEYNTKSQFATELNIGSDLDITNKYRADYSGLMKALENLAASRSADGGSDVATDDHIFFAHSYLNGLNLETVKDESFTGGIGGIYPDSQLQFNVFLSCARKVFRHGEIIRVGLDVNNKNVIKYLKADTASNMNAQGLSEPARIYETQDLPLSVLNDAYLTGRRFKFDCVLTQSEIDNLLLERIGLIQFNNTIENTTSYGYIKRCTIEIVSRKVEIELLEAPKASLSALASNFITEFTEENFITENTNEVLVTE